MLLDHKLPDRLHEFARSKRFNQAKFGEAAEGTGLAVDLHPRVLLLVWVRALHHHLPDCLIVPKLFENRIYEWRHLRHL